MQNIQDAFLNNARKERLHVSIYLMSGVKLTGRVRGFDKYCVVFETSHQEQMIFKHAISTMVVAKPMRDGPRGPSAFPDSHDQGPRDQGPREQGPRDQGNYREHSSSGEHGAPGDPVDD